MLTVTFFKFYLFALACFVVITFGADYLTRGISRQFVLLQVERYLRAAFVQTEADLLTFPQAQWKRRIQQLNRNYGFHLEISPIASLALTPNQKEKLDRHQIVHSTDEEFFYYRISQSDQAISVVRRLWSEQPHWVFAGLSLETWVRILSWITMSVFFSLSLWFWGRPIFRDMEALRQTAHEIGEGNLNVRLPSVESRLLKPLATTLNSMAERIQHLINIQKELSTSISHELRTPIARLHFIAEMIDESKALEESRHYSQMMKNDLEELDRLLDSSLTYSRFERENQQLSLAPVKIAEWLEEQVDAMKILAQSIDLRLDLDMVPPDLTLMIDENRMAHALSNLLRNATKYAHNKIQVSALLQEKDHLLLICIDDDGIGIPEHEREHVFSAFARLDRSRDRATGGHGLGLAICRRVLELHGGSVTVQASPLGGARFVMFWPMQPVSHTVE
ncbi:MAG: two-component sensor histidine kinase [Zoogloeaceae bacterium]|nr:two-component sensor histidine kinase [Zoogloeaceae bacterium]